MRKFALIILFLAVAGVALAEEITATRLLVMRGAGAKVEEMLALINEPANTVASPSPADLANLRAAGVPENVIAALQARVPAPPPAAAPARPDDARLVDIVRLIKAGLSESLVVEQVRRDGQAYALSVNDLVFLKENQVPESIIAALLGKPAGAPALPTAATAAQAAAAAPPQDVTFEPLLRQQGGFLVKNPTGSLALKGDRFEWYDNEKPQRNFSLQSGVLKSVWLVCEPRPQGNFCFELGLETLSGDTYSFRDVNWEAGGNVKILKLYETLKARLPQVVFHEKVKS